MRPRLEIVADIADRSHLGDIATNRTIQQLSPSHIRLTSRLRPSCDKKMLESWANRRKNVRLVAEVVGDRHNKISRSKVVVMLKTPKPQSHRAYEQVTTNLCPNFFGIVGKSYKERTTGRRGRGRSPGQNPS